MLTPVRKGKQQCGGSTNPIIFNDYESFVSKFSENPKTTDDCYTPPDVYDAVVKYVGTIYDMTDKVILRPFYPGGDYEHAEYPENGIVIDNPPFSMFTKICAFYTAHKIPFFIFGPGLTVGSCTKHCTAVIVAAQITFANGAKVQCNFASNLYGDTIITTAPLLNDLISECKSQTQKANLAKIGYPDEVLSVSQMQQICRGGVAFSVKRSECVRITKLDHLATNAHKGGLFADHFLLSSAKTAEKEAARLRAQEAARKAIPVELSDRERRIVERLNKDTI